MATDGVKARFANAITLVLAAPTYETREVLTGPAGLEPDVSAKISNCP